MGRNKHCTTEQRDLIRKMRAKGKTYQDIENTLGCSSKMIANAIKWRQKPETRGRKRKTTIQTDRHIVRVVKQQPFITSSEVVQQLQLNISSSLVRRRLIDANLAAKRPRRVPLLNSRHVKNRLKFAKERMNWPALKWRNILWSDESKIEILCNNIDKHYVRRPVNKEWHPQYTKKTVKHGGGSSVMIWGCFSWYGVGPICRIEGKMTADIYLKILRDTMLPYAEEEMPIRWVYMHDNDPKHTAARVKNWLQQQNIDVMPWPAQSPDINPIENLWIDVKKAVQEAKPSNVRQLWEVVKGAWSAITPERCQRLIESMPRRMEAILSNKGHTTKY